MTVLMLEDFDVPAHHQEPPETVKAAAPAPELSEADRLAAYEQGYQAGWDDAVKAQSEDQDRISAEFARNLRELSFTFHEARSHVIQSMEPLLKELVNTLLPGLIAETMAANLQEELRPLIAECADTPIELVVCPGGAALLEAPIAEFAGAAITVTEEPSLADGQAYFRVGKVERHVDLSGALEQMRAAFAALFELNERTLKYA